MIVPVGLVPPVIVALSLRTAPIAPLDGLGVVGRLVASTMTAAADSERSWLPRLIGVPLTMIDLMRMWYGEPLMPDAERAPSAQPQSNLAAMWPPHARTGVADVAVNVTEICCSWSPLLSRMLGAGPTYLMAAVSPVGIVGVASKNSITRCAAGMALNDVLGCSTVPACPGRRPRSRCRGSWSRRPRRSCVGSGMGAVRRSVVPSQPVTVEHGRSGLAATVVSGLCQRFLSVRKSMAWTPLWTTS